MDFLFESNRKKATLDSIDFYSDQNKKKIGSDIFNHFHSREIAYTVKMNTVGDEQYVSRNELNDE